VTANSFNPGLTLMLEKGQNFNRYRQAITCIYVENILDLTTHGGYDEMFIAELL
jgi:hypothetical protein